MTPEQWDIVQKLGIPVAMLLFFVYGQSREKEYWLMGSAHRREIEAYRRENEQLREMLAKAEKSEDRWLNAVLELKGLASHAVTLVREVKDAV